MNCAKCGTPLNKGIVSCPKCGTPVTTALNSLQDRLDQAKRMRDMQLYAKAIPLYQALLTDSDITDQALIHELIGETYLELKKPTDAINAFEMALTLQPTVEIMQKIETAREQITAAVALKATKKNVIKNTSAKPASGVVTKQVTDSNVVSEVASAVNKFDFMEFWHSLLSPEKVNKVTIIAVVIMVISLTTLLRPWHWFAPKPTPISYPSHVRSRPPTAIINQSR